MRSAPAVSVRCTNDAAWRWAQTLLPALAAGVGALWWLLRLDEPLSQPGWLAGAAFAVAAAVAWRASARSAAVLAWDGQTWSLDGQPGAAAVMIDLDGWMLLKFCPVPDGSTMAPAHRPGVAWMGLGATRAGPAWHGLRVALYAWQAQALPASRATGRAP
jgi:hypothetical protein